MPTTEYLARDCTFELNTGTHDVPDWLEILDLSKWGHTPKANDADTTTFRDAGRMSHMKASRGDSFTLTGLAQEDPDNGDQDPGQEAVEAWADEIGPDSVKEFRISTPGGQVRTFDATATVTFGGGGNDDANTWEAELTVTGAIVKA